MEHAGRFPLGAAVTLDELDREPHPLLARLRAAEPVSWLPSLGGWLVTRHDLALAVMRDAEAFTVDDPRFSTQQVVGPSMLSLDGAEHRRHRDPFVSPFRAAAVERRFGGAAAAQAERLVEGLASTGAAELRDAFAGPLAAAIIAEALGLGAGAADEVLATYRAIVASVTAITAGDGPTEAGRAAFAGLSERLREVIRRGGETSLLASAAGQTSLSDEQIISNGAVLLFGGIETTEGMIANAALHLMARPELLQWASQEPSRLDGVIDESLRLEPAAAVVDRYATADTTLGGVDGARIGAGDLVRVSIAAANRDPAVFANPDSFDPNRPNLRRHLAFAQGPHVCVGVHLARLEARQALAALIRRLPGLRLDPARPPEVRGLVFRKPVSLHACWDTGPTRAAGPAGA